MVKGYPLVLIVPLVSVNGRRVESTPTKPRAIGNISFPHDVFYQRNTILSFYTTHLSDPDSYWFQTLLSDVLVVLLLTFFIISKDAPIDMPCLKKNYTMMYLQEVTLLTLPSHRRAQRIIRIEREKGLGKC